MTLNQIDVALALWQTELDLAGANCLELDDLFTCKRLKGSAGNTLAGITRDKIVPTLAAMDHLW